MPDLRYQRYITLTYIPGAKIHIFAVLHKLRYNNGQDVKQFSINQSKRDNACIRLIRLRIFFNFRSYYSFVHTLHRRPLERGKWQLLKPFRISPIFYRFWYTIKTYIDLIFIILLRKLLANVHATFALHKYYMTRNICEYVFRISAKHI